MNAKIINKKRGISPIIATLLLILIAIAAGVVVYAYVIGFVGNSTGNSGATTNTLSIDQLALSSKTTSFPATAFVRNEGPSTESFNTGFFVKGSSLNDQLAPAISVFASAGTTTITTVTLGARSNGSLGFTISASACGVSATFTVSAFGATRAGVTCSTSSPVTSSVTPTGITFTNGTAANFATDTLTGTTVGTTAGTATIVGLSVTAGASFSISINNVGQLTLAMPASTSTASNPLTAGQTYTFQVTGTDGGSTAASGKSS